MDKSAIQITRKKTKKKHRNNNKSKEVDRFQTPIYIVNLIMKLFVQKVHIERYLL